MLKNYLVLIGTLAIAPVALAQVTPRSNEGEQRYYSDNASKIAALRAKALDETAPIEARKEALKTLFGRYNLAALEPARALVTAKDEGLAVLAVEIVSTKVIMSDHHHAFKTHNKMTPAQAEVMSSHELAKDALRTAVVDPRLAVRERCASLLASLDDKPALDALAAASQGPTPTLSRREFAGYVAASSAPVMAQYAAPLLSDPSTDVRIAAIHAVSGSKALAPQIELLAFTTSQPLDVRIAALTSLAPAESRSAELTALALDFSQPAQLRAAATKPLVESLAVGSSETAVPTALSSLRAAELRESKGVYRDAIRGLESIARD